MEDYRFNWLGRGALLVPCPAKNGSLVLIPFPAATSAVLDPIEHFFGEIISAVGRGDLSCSLLQEQTIRRRSASNFLLSVLNEP
jgi:hypothetical protein